MLKKVKLSNQDCLKLKTHFTGKLVIKGDIALALIAQCQVDTEGVLTSFIRFLVDPTKGATFMFQFEPSALPVTCDMLMRDYPYLDLPSEAFVPSFAYGVFEKQIGKL